jgi:hypothetical protein
MDRTDISNILTGVFNNKPVDVAAAFNTAIQSKMNELIANRKMEIAQSLYGTLNVDNSTQQESDSTDNEE